MELNIKRNPATGGFYCFFDHEGQQYYADLSFTFDAGEECMIFPSKDEKVTDWWELYAKRGISVTEDNLRICVEEFISELKEEGE